MLFGKNAWHRPGIERRMENGRWMCACPFQWLQSACFYVTVALRHLNFDQAKTERKQDWTQKRGIFFENIIRQIAIRQFAGMWTCVHVAGAWGFYSCDAFSTPECRSACIRSLHAQTRAHAILSQAAENEINFVYEYHQQQKQQQQQQQQRRQQRWQQR